MTKFRKSVILTSCCEYVILDVQRSSRIWACYDPGPQHFGGSKDGEVANDSQEGQRTPTSANAAPPWRWKRQRRAGRWRPDGQAGPSAGAHRRACGLRLGAHRLAAPGLPQAVGDRTSVPPSTLRRGQLHI